VEILQKLRDPYIFMSHEGLLVEGVCKIILWESERIILLSREKISVAGESLRLECRGRETVLLSGRIRSVEFFEC
jgi:hypothetical protein